MFELSWIMLHAFLVYLQWSPDIDLLFDNEIAWTETNEKLAIATSYGLWSYDFLIDESFLFSECNIQIFNPVFNYDGSLLAYTTNDGIIHIIDIEKEEELGSLNTGFIISDMLFDETRSKLIFSIFDPSQYLFRLFVWDYIEDNLVMEIDTKVVVTDLYLDSSTNTLWVSGTEFEMDITPAYVWAVDLISGNTVLHMPLQSADAGSVRVDNGTIVYSIRDQQLNAYYLLVQDMTGYYNVPYIIHYNESIYTFDITSELKRVAMIHSDGYIRVRPFFSMPAHHYELELEHNNAIAVRFSPNGKYLAIQSSSELPEVEIWDMESMTQTITLRTADWYQADCGE